MRNPVQEAHNSRQDNAVKEYLSQTAKWINGWNKAQKKINREEA